MTARLIQEIPFLFCLNRLHFSIICTEEMCSTMKKLLPTIYLFNTFFEILFAIYIFRAYFELIYAPLLVFVFSPVYVP